MGRGGADAAGPWSSGETLEVTKTGAVFPRDEPESGACLVLIGASSLLGARFDLSHAHVVVGRADGCGVPLEDTSVSRRHALLARRGATYSVRDLGSRNGTYVNGERVVAERPLRDGDQLTFGGVVLKFLRGGNVELAYHEELHRLSTRDPLTRVLNRRSLLAELERETDRARRYGRPLSVALLDVDRFKRVNDRFGHAAGDRVLVAIATLIECHVRCNDRLGRWGGEEFLLVLPETRPEHARDGVEKLRGLIAAEAIDVGGPHIGVTASFGVAAFGAAAEDAPALIAAADARLYEAKAAGRNRVAWREDG